MNSALIGAGAFGTAFDHLCVDQVISPRILDM